MRKVVTLVAFAALAWGAVSTVQAADVSVAVGQTGDSTMTYRLGTQFDFQQSWFASDVGRLTGYWDGRTPFGMAMKRPVIRACR
jgi:lipid A 3-O-deacylase